MRAGQVGDPLVGDVVALPVWHAVLDDVLRRYGDQLNGKVVVDITNPIDVESFEPLELEAGSAAQEIAARRQARRSSRRSTRRSRARSSTGASPGTRYASAVKVLS